MSSVTCPIVAIGASAGGLEAASELLAALPARTGLAYVVIQHLDPTHESLLTELLAKRTAMPVGTAREGLALEPDHVYVIPRNATLTLHEGRFRVTPRVSAPTRHMPVDSFFKSIADTCGDRAIAVILSGGDSDGSLGVQEIKDRGGITFAQEPSSARFPSMPQSGIETGCVDFVLRPAQIAEELVRLGKHPYLGSRDMSAVRAAPEAAEVAEGARVPEAESLRRVFRRLRSTHGVDFTHYKRSTLHRRLARRMALRKIEDPADYVALIESDPTEAATLYQDFLIRVTGFFRDPESFESLAQRVFPALFEGRPPKEPVRIWVPGCATGEEVYSIAMALMEYLGERLAPEGIQIFGTDVSEAAIEKARAGVYVDSIAQDVSPERLSRFFVKADAHYRIAKSIRDLCIFARQDVTRDPPFSRLDLVSCRNLLIYLDAAVQRRVMQVFHYSLRPHGFLVLGPSESVGQASDLFDLTDKHHRIYTRRTTPPGTVVDLVTRGSGPYGRPREGLRDEPALPVEVDPLQREADRMLLARFAPPSLLVDEALNILHVRGETSPFLEFASGAPSLNLHRVARSELLVEIVPAVQEARETGAVTRREGLHVDELQDVSIEVIPLKRLDMERGYLILFDDGSRRSSARRAQVAVMRGLPESEKDRRLAQLEREIGSIRDYLQATMEEHEAVKEELKSAHEEVLSANEEFQSTNEELETSKEELQSANEELTTTNDELRNRNRELSVLNAELDKERNASEQARRAAEQARVASEHARRYADAIVDSVSQPLLVLDEELRVLRANQAYYVEFRESREATEGRPWFEIDNGRWDVPPLRERLDALITRGEPLGRCEIPHDFSFRGPRLLSLAARKIPGEGERAELILLSMEDITERRARSDALEEGGRRKDEFLAMLAHELRNPLSPISHAIHLLRHTHADPASTRLYEMIGRQTQRLVRLVDELLDVARISRGLITVKQDELDLVDVVRQAADASRIRIEQGQHAFSLVLPDEPVLVKGDAVRLEQVICNLLENAAKYTNPDGQITLTLTQQNGRAVLSVRDTGIGLAPEMLEGVFELFTQVDASLPRTGGGLGLGLAVVRRILELHGGRIEARSAGLGMGSEFVVHLPTSTANKQLSAPSLEELTLTGAQTRRVIVVDDVADSAQSLALLIRSWGHEVVTASDGVGALELAADFKPDTAIIDIGLPGIDGYELARRLRKDPQHRDMHLLAVTGYGRAEDRDATRGAGFDVHLIKPARIEELRYLVARGRIGSRP